MSAPQFDSIKDSIAAFKNGEFLVVLDSADRENEGDLIIAAEDLTTEKMAFMVRYTRSACLPHRKIYPPQLANRELCLCSGLICAPLSPELINKFDLPQMVANNQEPHATAFTVSVDSRDPSISTGISAYDRALTARKLADPASTAKDFRSPGHLFPLAAVKGGVRERRGHTEAAVELAKLAGKSGATAICELVKEEDGLMMRRDECLEFGKKWGFKVCTIEDLADYLNKQGL
jgi:3,4-dihydroxy 2-butanone 4-phosphate synthase